MKKYVIFFLKKVMSGMSFVIVLLKPYQNLHDDCKLEHSKNLQ